MWNSQNIPLGDLSWKSHQRFFKFKNLTLGEAETSGRQRVLVSPPELYNSPQQIATRSSLVLGHDIYRQAMYKGHISLLDAALSPKSSCTSATLWPSVCFVFVMLVSSGIQKESKLWIRPSRGSGSTCVCVCVCVCVVCVCVCVSKKKKNTSLLVSTVCPLSRQFQFSSSVAHDCEKNYQWIDCVAW